MASRDLGWDLLMEHLDRKQRKEMEERAAFTVKAPSGQKYLLRWGDTVIMLDSADLYSEDRRLCWIANCGEFVPESDRLLAIMMALYTDENHARSIAGSG